MTTSTSTSTPDTMLSPPTDSAEDYAITLYSHRTFHQWTTYTLPSSPTTENNISFSTTTNFTSPGADKLPTLLIIGPMVCSRYFAAWYNHLALKLAVRLIFMDRPGFGHSTPVPLRERIPATLAAIRSILSHLHVSHIALLSASAGAVYIPSLLTRARDLLHPTRPYVSVLVPWIHPRNSGCKLLATASALPASVISLFPSVQKFVATKVAPGLGWSGGLVESVGAAFRGKVEQAVGTEKAAEEERCVELYGVGMGTKDVVDKVGIGYVFAEPIGIRDEALFSLQKDLEPSVWGEAADLPAFVQRLVVSERERRNKYLKQEKLRYRAYFAESDMLIGEGGRAYFESCWRDAEGVDEAIDYKDTVVKGTDHESIVGALKGPMADIFEAIKEGWED